MQRSPGYRFTAAITTPGSSVTITGEFQAPDRVHEVVQIGTTASSELVMIGPQVYAKDRSGTWRSTTSTGPAPTDLRSTFATLGSADHVKRRANTITFHLRADAAKMLVGASTARGLAGSATVGRGGISRLRYRARTGGRDVIVTIDYVVTNPPPTVAAPH